MRELGDPSEHHQTRQLREQIHSGRLNIKQSVNVALPVKQHTEYHLGVKFVRKSEQEHGISRGDPSRKSNKHTHLLIRRLNGMAGGRVRGGMSCGSGLKDGPDDVMFSEFE